MKHGIGKVFANYLSDKGLVCKYVKNIYNSGLKDNPVKNGQKI